MHKLYYYFTFKKQVDELWTAEFGYRTPALPSRELVVAYLKEHITDLSETILEDSKDIILSDFYWEGDEDAEEKADIIRKDIEKWVNSDLRCVPKWIRIDCEAALEAIPVQEPQDMYYGILFIEYGKYSEYEYYRTDVYPSYEAAKAAFLDLSTMELFQAAIELTKNEDAPISFEDEYDDAEDIKNAYDDGVEDVIEAVNKLQDWISGNKELDEEFGIDFCEYRVVIHR